MLAEEPRFAHAAPAGRPEIVRKHGPLGPSEIHERYSEDVEDPRTKQPYMQEFVRV